MTEYTLEIYLKNGEVRKTAYGDIVRDLRLLDEYFLGESLSKASPENALYAADVLQFRFSGEVDKVIVYQDGKEI